MKNIKKLFIFLLALGVSLSTLNLLNFRSIEASSVSISANTSTVSPGGVFTVSVNIVGGGSGMFYFSGSNATVSTGSLYCDGACSISATAGSSGYASVSVSTGQPGTPNEVTDLDGNTINYSSSVGVTIKSNTSGNTGGNTTTPPSGNTNPNTNPNTGSGNQSDDDEKDKPTKDATSILASLSIDKGELSPKFSPTETSYKVNLPAGTTALNVSAKAKNNKAKVEGSGNVKLTVGDNTITIRCIAEDGTVTTYTIKAHVSEKPVTYVTYKNTKLGVLNEAAPVSKLFTETKIKVNDKEVIAWKNQALKLTLLYMQNEKENTKELYIYDTVKKQAISIYKPFTYQGKNLVMIDVPEKLQKREGMKFTTISLGEYTLPGWTFNDSKFKNYALLYVMDEKGNTLYYQYEKTEDSLQIYSQAAAIQQEDYQKYVEEMEQKSNLYLMIMLGLGILGILLLIILIIVIIKGKSRVKYKKVPVQNTMLGAEAKSLLRDDDDE